MSNETVDDIQRDYERMEKEVLNDEILSGLSKIYEDWKKAVMQKRQEKNDEKY
jgi:hypothetical protein